MANTATVTAKIGPAIQATATVLSNVTNIDLNIGADVIMIDHQGGRTFYSASGVTTFTVSISGGAYTITIS